MPGISAYGAYVPRYRLGAETDGWDSAGQRSVANFDEDSVSMAVAAAIDCLNGREREEIDGLLFATTTPPYAEKQCASIIATALDLRRDIFTADITDVLRAGTTALKSALDSVAAGSAKNVLMVASDNRQGPPKSEAERNSGDGAVAFIISEDAVIAEQAGSYTITENMMDTWRSAGDQFVRSWEDRFAIEEGLERIIGEAISGFMEKEGVSVKDVTKLALYSPDARRHGQLARHLGFQPEQVQDPLFGRMGNTGAAFPLMLLAGALEDGSPDQLLLTVAYGDGSDVLGFRTTSKIGERGQGLGVSGFLDSGQVLDSYETYAKWRNVWLTDSSSRRPDPQSPSVTALWRESDQNIKFHGGVCNQCGYVQYPPQRVCVECQSRDDSTPIRLSDKLGTVFTYSLDYLAGTVDTPLAVVVVDYEPGGRVLCMMTDREVGEVQIGMPVQMSFRKLRVVNGIHNYYWKAVPLRRAA
ncbi:MAG: hydroxymethylglutaryl-CoA synthase family protein [SAR202 cluster bacterium]|nr:OB-fold domain-containing protein [Dehalococcoidia bacterium]MQF90910.1 hydroxymethylglutaryl-CoA synthase family protein [SAR202 cluster bacterium]MQG63394.1 hydroxymethylglutaryl-CoA synthase family protein [SAR202 cluster bacterium]MQG72972.1 hydroxymethylglutaryl-CoA synthase family protein [SAR202 cluster bacterium]